MDVLQFVQKLVNGVGEGISGMLVGAETWNSRNFGKVDDCSMVSPLKNNAVHGSYMMFVESPF